MNRKKFFRVLKVALLIYGVVGIAIFYLQDYLVLRPVKLAPDYQFKFPQPFVEVNIPFDKNTTINVVQFKSGDSARGVVLYFHGNKTNITRYSRFADFFTRSGYEVWMMDYPGYGKSTGVFSEKAVYAIAASVYKMARARFKSQEIVIYGKSLGTGIASQLAAARDCKYLLLETPYYSLPSVIGFYAPIYPVNRLMRNKFPIYEYIPQVTAPIVIFHGTSDWVVRYSNSRKLQPLLKPGDELVTLEGGKHNDLFKFPTVAQKIDSLLR